MNDIKNRWKQTKRDKHRKNCECCRHHSLFKGHNVNINIVVLNYQKWNQCLKCQVSGYKSLGLLFDGDFAAALTHFHLKETSARTPLLQGDFCTVHLEYVSQAKYRPFDTSGNQLWSCSHIGGCNKWSRILLGFSDSIGLPLIGLTPF